MKLIFKTLKLITLAIYRRILGSCLGFLKNSPPLIIGNYELAYPPKHQLPEFLRLHPLYDRFIPCLVEYLETKTLILDIGANIGDTTLAILQTCENDILSIEPDELYFEYLQKNLKRLPLELRGRASIVKAFIGTGKYDGHYRHYEGTGFLEFDKLSNEPHSFMSLDSLISDKAVSFIKVDTDGMDFDVLLSGKKGIKKLEPILFWENYLIDEKQKEGFEELYNFLLSVGYSRFHVFDNFGNLLLKNTCIGSIKSINEYLLSQKKIDGMISIFYVDIVASTVSKSHILDMAIENFKLKRELVYDDVTS